MTSFSVADGTIQKITSSPGKLSIEITDWQEQNWTLFFDNLIAFQSIGAEGEEVSEITTDKTEFFNLINQSDLDASSKSYCFISAWSSNPVLTIVASGFKAIKST